MNRIKVLDAAVANRIAAGEVVTGPASVVKELAENAIDALSTAVTIEIREGGRAAIRVTDNGSGIHPQDVLLSVKKHATSKIASFEDIKHIASLGFRGEALSSIAAVSNLIIKTRVAGEMEGCILSAAAGDFQVKPAGLPDGTTVIVENLFYNVPARLKFLKSAAAEAAAVSDLVSRLALSRPDLSFKYIINGVLQFQSPGTGKLLDAITAVYGKTVRSRLFEVHDQEGGMQVEGFVSNPNYLFKSAKNQTLLINGRYIKSKSISEALARAYGERLLKGHFPFAVLNIRLPFEDVDVNVHPSKTTVLIHNEEQLAGLLDKAVKQVLLNAALPAFETAPVKNSENIEKHLEIKEPIQSVSYILKNTFITPGEANPKPVLHVKQSFVPARFDELVIPQIADETAEAEQTEEQQKIAAVDELVDYEIVGQIFSTYVLVQSGESAYIIDQHAAHERMNYERLKNMDILKPQRLLFPYALKLSQADHDLLLQNSGLLKTLGFEIEDFGVNTLKITALPLRSEQSEIEGLMEDVTDILRHAGNEITLFKDRIIRRACRTSIKAGDALSGFEMQQLIREMTASKTIPVCPHGRPVAIVLTKGELEKNFKRRV